MSENNKTNNSFGRVKSIYSVLIVISLILGFFLGFIATKSLGFLDRALSPDSTQNTSKIDVSNISNEEFLDDSYLNEILNIFDSRYIKDLEDYNSDNITYGAIKGIIESLDDPYTSFLSPDEAESYLDQRSSDFEGIGVTLGYQDGYTYIESVIKEHPAEKEGLRSRDVILEVDEEDITGQYPSDVASKIRGPKGTTVKLKVLRTNDQSQETLDFEIERDTIEIDNVTWKELEDGIVEISIVQFSDESIDIFNKSWDKVVSEIEAEVDDLDGIIVDVRNNPGGYVKGVQHVLEEFLESGEIIMQEKAKDTPAEIYKDKREGAFEDVDVVVLVNEGSASASEIFASGLSENGKAVIVGKPTVGKGVEQELIQLSDGSILLIVFQQWLTPDGNEISQDNPIKPDHEVEYTIENFNAGEDPQLDKALELIKD